VDEDNSKDTESPHDRVNRELTELLGELRIALPGVQMLFAFLLTVPFQASFAKLSTLLRGAFFFTFVVTTVAAIFLIAPSSNHRISFRAHDKETLLLRANAYSIVGIAFLALAICGVVFFISGMLLGERWAPEASLLTFLLIVTTWYALPLWRRAHARRRP